MSSKLKRSWFDSLISPFTRQRNAKGARLAHADQVTSRTLAACPTPPTGFAALPEELLLEIFSYLPSVPVPCVAHPFLYEKEYLVRNQTLRSVSRTCRRLRQATLPVLWERIEACASGKIEEYRNRPNKKIKIISWREDVGRQLLGQLKVVLDVNPSLAEHVRIVNVVLNEYREKVITKKLVRALARFPNLHTIQFMGTGETVDGSSATPSWYFKNSVFPSVRTLALAWYARGIVSSFPNTTLLLLLSGQWPLTFVIRESVDDGYLQNLQEVRIITILSSARAAAAIYGWLYQALSTHCPKLQVLTFDTWRTRFDKAAVQTIATYSDLRKVIFKVGSLPSDGCAIQNDLIEEGVAAMKLLPPVQGVKRQLILEDSSGVRSVYFETVGGD